MLSADGKHLYVESGKYNDLMEKLAVKIYASGWQFDQIICLARGGMRPGDALSRIFAKPLAVMSTSSYRGDGGFEQNQLNIAEHITTSEASICGCVLLVDDLADTGVTMRAVVDKIQREHPAITELRTAVLWVKGKSGYKPDYYVDYLPSSPWIHQPFERFEKLSLPELKRRWS